MESTSNKMRNWFWVFVIFFQFTIILELNSRDEAPFFFDAICFKSQQDDKLSRIDVYVVVPYYSLTFIKSNNKYIADYSLTFTLKDSLENIVHSKNLGKRIIEEEQLETLGFSAKFQQTYFKFEIPEGKYSIEVSLFDKNSNQTYKKRRTSNALDFSRYNFAFSGIMFLSDIEETNNEFKITPFLSDNLGNIDKVFVFLETYQTNKTYNSIDLVYQIVNTKGKEVYRSPRKTFILKELDQIYFPLNKSNLKEGNYFLKVFALKPTSKKDSIFLENEILSASERSFEIAPQIINKVLANIDKSIRQLKYVAYQSDIDYINQATNNEEKSRRFLEFWKKLDPTPGTEFNEAFEEYYERVNYSNSNFKSYVEGWQTDRGMVYIVLGPPATIQNQIDFNSNRNFEIWNYSNRTFIFIDYSGFGDFRLYSPPTFSEKYKYRH